MSEELNSLLPWAVVALAVSWAAMREWRNGNTRDARLLTVLGLGGGVGTVLAWAL
jgi:hypothetical protein